MPSGILELKVRPSGEAIRKPLCPYICALLVQAAKSMINSLSVSFDFVV